MMKDIGWLTQRPIAHRGLHDKAHHIIENTTSAFAAAILNGYAIETDLQLTKDGEIAVFHDATKDRLLKTKGSVLNTTMQQLSKADFKDTVDHVQSLTQLLKQVSGRVPLVLEIKAHDDGDGTLERRIAEVIKDYAGQLALMSFNPDTIANLTELSPERPCGLVAERVNWGQIAQYKHVKFDFLAYDVRNLPSLFPLCAKYLLGMPLITWTVRSQNDRKRARWADQIIFENFTPQMSTSP